MATNYAEIAFGDEAKKLQERFGSRSVYERMEKQAFYDGLTEQEEGFIGERDSFYVASVGENGYPYIQHRGGPKGFLKVIDSNTLAFADFKGNKQYVSTGNITTNNKVALMLMDYPHRARLKIYATAEIVELGEDPALEKQVFLKGYGGKEERIIKLAVEAYDWNCQQHITPRYTGTQVEEAFARQKEYMKRLETENKRLKEALGGNDFVKLWVLFLHLRCLCLAIKLQRKVYPVVKISLAA